MRKSPKIKSIKAREILDSKGDPTVEVKLRTDFGIFKALTPSGISTGRYEAVEIRDGGKRYFGKGVKKAIRNIERIIAPKLKGKDTTKQKEIDDLMIELDGTKNKSRLGANAILPVSMAVCRAGAEAKRLPLYKYIAYLSGTPISKVRASGIQPCFLIIEGGLHAGGNLDIQEFMIVPKAGSFKEKVRIGTEVYQTLRSILNKKYGSSATNVGQEGGLTPPVNKTDKALDLIIMAAREAGHLSRIGIILDAAASTFYQKNSYILEESIFTSDGLIKFFSELCRNYPIIALEDPLAEEDWEGFKKITEEFKNISDGKSKRKITIIGDDLLVTNIKRIKKAVQEKACNGLILKLNQIGTVSEAIEAARYALKNKWQVFVKHRSGETVDDFIADLAVGLGNTWIMAGAPCRGERVTKYNRILEIEEENNK